jgi:hypothetical protein
MQGIEKFADRARAYCNWAEDAHSPMTVAVALARLTELYLCALQLRDAFADEEATGIPHSEWRNVFDRFATLPLNHYSTCFDPLVIPAEEPVVGSIPDDFADIWRDVKGGLALYEAGYVEAAAWEWRFHFLHHWGQHSVRAIHALHSYLADNPCELPPNNALQPTCEDARG